jgi:hypothetical protein
MSQYILLLNALTAVRKDGNLNTSCVEILMSSGNTE